MFKKLLNRIGAKGSSDINSGVTPLPSTVSAAILNTVGARSIPPMPGGAQKAFQLSTDPNAEARDFVEVIESDEALSARVMRVANSVYFDRGKGSKTIDEAVLVIGINELRCLLNATTLSELFPSKSPLRTALWAHDIATAVIARTLAARLRPNQGDLLFLGGLMHDIGKLLLLQRAPAELSKAIALAAEKGIELFEAEGLVFPFDHTEVGQLIGEKWNFSKELLDIIRNHHRVGEFNNRTARQATRQGGPTNPEIIWAADTIAHALALGTGKLMQNTQIKAKQRLNDVWAMLATPETERSQFLQSLSQEFEREHEKLSS